MPYNNKVIYVKQFEKFSICEIQRTGSAVQCQVHVDTPMRNIRSCQAVPSLHRPWNYPSDYRDPIQSKFSLDHHDSLVNLHKLMHDISWENLSIITNTTKNHYGYKELAQTVPKTQLYMLFPLSFEMEKENMPLLCFQRHSVISKFFGRI